jgi:methyl-accepting chemotaxis protein
MATGVICVILLIGITSYISVNELIKANKMVSHSREVLQELNMLMHNLSETVCSQRNYLISGEEVYLDAYRSLTGATNSNINEVITLVADNPQQSFRARQLDNLIKERLASLEVTTSLFQQKGREAAFNRVRHGRSLQFRNALHKAIDEMKNEEIGLLQSRADEMRRSASSTQLTIITGVILGLAIAALFNYLFAKYILNCINQLIRSADNIRYGRFDLWAFINSNDEFAELASAFNTVGQQLLSVSNKLAEQEQKLTAMTSAAHSANTEMEQLRTKLLSMSQISQSDQGLLNQQNEYLSELHESFSHLNDLSIQLERVARNSQEIIYCIGNTRRRAEDNATLLTNRFQAEQEIHKNKELLQLNLQLSHLETFSKAFESIIASLDMLTTTATLEQSRRNTSDGQHFTTIILDRLKEIIAEAKNDKSNFYEKLCQLRSLVQALTSFYDTHVEVLAKEQVLIEGLRSELVKESDFYRTLSDNQLDAIVQNYIKLINGKKLLPEKLQSNLDHIRKSAQQRQSLVSESVSTASELLASTRVNS